LRWRADSLLDEMMLGGVDVSAADSSGPPTSTDAQPHSPTAASPHVHDNAQANRPAYRDGPDHPHPDSYPDHRDVGYDLGYNDVGSGLGGEEVSPFEPEPDDPPSTLNSQYAGLDSYRSVLDSAPALDDDPEV